MDLPPGWLTDIAVLRLSGAAIEDRGDHHVVTSADNPGYLWGNFLLVTDPRARNYAARWVELSGSSCAVTMPRAGWSARQVERS